MTMYVNLQTGELLEPKEMWKQFCEEYDGNDPTNCIGIDEYYRKVVL